MSYEQFLDSLREPAPPVDLELALKALWYDANGRDASAWRIARADDSHVGKRITAYLHRKRGDEKAARLWYWRAGASAWTGSLESEWDDIVKTVLAERVVANAYS